MQTINKLHVKSIHRGFLLFACLIITSFSNSLNVQAQYTPNTFLQIYNVEIVGTDLDRGINELEVARQLFKQAFITLNEQDNMVHDHQVKNGKIKNTNRNLKTL